MSAVSASALRPARRSGGAGPGPVRRRRTVLGLTAVVALVALVAWVASSGGSPAKGGGGPRDVRVVLPSSVRLGTLGGALAAPAPLPWPAAGQGAVSIPLLGFSAQSGAEQPVPVASLTKIMTAYVVLRDHPLEQGEQGPPITVTASDAANFGTDTVTDQASVELQAGEVLSEYQMLEGLLVHSANDLAYALARWDAGSVAAFVAKMNATAASLGMGHTHFADASGFDPGSTSTAADLLKVAAQAMTDPAFASIVAMPSVTLPLAGTLGSYTPLLGTPGVLGVKSGFTDVAGGGDVLAYRAAVGGQTFIVLAAAVAQEGPTVLVRAGHEALALAQAAAGRVRSETVARAGTVVARLGAPPHRVAATLASPASVLYLPGDRVGQVVRVRAPAPGTHAGALIGTAVFTVGAEAVSVPVRLAARLP